MQVLKQKPTFFESIKKGLEEAIDWKQGKDTGAVVHTYKASDIDNIRNKKPA